MVIIKSTLDFCHFVVFKFSTDDIPFYYLYWGGHLPILWPWCATAWRHKGLFFLVSYPLYYTADHYSSKNPIEIDFAMKEFPQNPWSSKMSSSWTLPFCQFFCEAGHSIEAQTASFSQDNKKNRKIKTGIQARVVFLSLRTSYLLAAMCLWTYKLLWFSRAVFYVGCF